ncbi:hypothetical protein [Salinigranum salinum]|uniref:hypothetical protein n=1 Tax=Salinigranum salinum TaxID=1364937 RepID=UPI001864F7AF|nr:hypothetical protein [Salinigranum salinum]
MSRLLSIVSRVVPRPVPRRCRANAWASVYAEVYDVEPRTDGGHDARETHDER